MELLDKFLDDYLPQPKKKKDYYNLCCVYRNRILSPNLNVYVCVKCGIVYKEEMYQVDYPEKFKGNYVKTFMNFSQNIRTFYRLHIWENFNRLEVKMNEYFIFIDKLPIRDQKILDNTKYLYKNYLPTLNIRGNNRKALICYCLYKSHLDFKKPVDIDELLVMLNLKYKNYNDLNSKLPNQRLYHIKNLDYYIRFTGNKINKNYLIKIYNLFFDISTEYNNKTLILGLIYYILKKNDLNDDEWRDNFVTKFNISENSLFVILLHITHNKNIIYEYIEDNE